MIKHISLDDYGYLTGTAITGTYQDLIALTDDADFILVFNSCDKALILKVPSKAERSTSVSTKEIRVPSGLSFTIDCRANQKRFPKGTIQVKHAGAAPTTGEVTVTAGR